MLKRIPFILTLVVATMLICSAVASPAVPTDAEIVRQFIVDDPHHGEYCSEDAQTVREFGTGTKYGPIMTNGVPDTLFSKGGFLFGPTDKETLKIYAIAVDFPDVAGDMQITHGRHRNVVKAPAYGNTVIDFSDPQVHFDYLFGGSEALKKNPKVEWKGSVAQEYKGIERVLSEMSMGRLNIEVELLNERYAEAMSIDTTEVRTPWFHLDEPIFGYSTAGPADCEDYHQFVRLFQAAMNIADKELKAAGLNDSVVGKGANFEDIGFIYVLTPFNAFGYRLGFQGGGGIMAAYSVNEQALSLRDSEYRHVPGALTPGGRMVGSGSFGMKGPFNMSSANPAASAVVTQSHELIHGLGFFDDYAYGYMGDEGNKYFVSNIGESPHSGANRWGTMDQYSDLRTVTPDPPIWRKYRMGWIHDDEIELVLPSSTPQTVYLRASGSAPGIDGGSYTDNASIKTRMVVIPKEYRTRDTFGLLWTNLWNPNGAHYDWYEWFVNLWVGGETYAMKSFPTFYTLESRKALGADGKPLGYYSGLPSTRDGVVVSYIANPTWETGHGAGGFKIMTGDYGLNATPGRTKSWIDPHIGLTITVTESTAFYDKVEVAYTGVATTEAKHVYQGLLTASENFAVAEEEFTVDFAITTLGTPAIDDHGLTTERSVQSGGLQGTTPMTSLDPAPPLPTEVKRVATPLGVPGGIAGFIMEVTFDATTLEYVPDSDDGPFTCAVDITDVGTGKLIVTGVGSEMVDKNTILSLDFKAKSGAADGDYTVNAKITDVTLLNWRGEKLVKGNPGFDGVGTFGDGTLAAFYNTVASNALASNDIRSTGGKVTVGSAATYTISGTIVCDTPGPASSTWIGVESVVELYNSSNAKIASTKSDWDGNYIIKGVAAGSGYYIKANKPKYAEGTTAGFNVAAATTVPELKLERQKYPISGTIYGAVNSDGSGKVPLAGVDVYVVSIGNAYRVLGGPATTDAEGKYTVYATTDSEKKAFAGLAVKVAGNAEKYGTQLTVFAKDSLTGKYDGLDPGEDLHLNMGTQPHLILDDYVYPANTSRLGQEGTFAFYLGGEDSKVVTGRDLILTETQDVHIRAQTKSTEIYYQLRKLSDGSVVGGKVKSVGTNNGDDIIRNVSPDQYYIEVTRDGYVTLNTMPFSVFTTRVLLRDGQTTNTLNLNTLLGNTIVSGTVVNAVTREPLSGVSIVFQSWSYTGGMGNPITSGEDGTFSYDVLADDKDIIFSKAGYSTETLNIASGGATGLVIGLMPDELGAGELFITNVAAKNREYNGTNVVELEYTSGSTPVFLGLDDDDIGKVSVTLGNGTMADKNAGNSKGVTTNIQLTGESAGKYTLFQPASIKVNITPKTLTIIGVEAVDRDYDGTTIVKIIGGEFDEGVLTGDNVVPLLPTTGTMSDANIGEGKTVTISGIALDGGDKNNYSVPATMTVTVDIAKKAISGVINIVADMAGDVIAVADELSVNIGSVIPSGLVFGTDYDIAWSSEGGTTTSETYTVAATDTTISVKIIAKGNYKGELTSVPVIKGKKPLADVISISQDEETLEIDGLTVDLETDCDIKWLRDGEVIEGATGDTYTLTPDDYGKTITVLVVGKGDYTGSISANINILETEPSAVITITTQPASVTVTAGSISGSLSVVATVTEGAVLSYQWHSNTTASNAGGTPIQDAESASFVIPKSLTVGTYYYYCVVSATKDATPVASNVATVTVNSGGGGGGGGGGAAAKDSSLPKTSASYDPESGDGVTVTIDLNGNTLKDIKEGNTTLKKGTDYTVSGNTITFTPEFLASLDPGKHTFTFIMSGGKNLTFTITIEDGDTPLGGSGYKPMAPLDPAGTKVNATKTSNTLKLGEDELVFPAVKIGGYNWLKLRDIAKLLMDTEKKFSVKYDEATGIIDIVTGGVYEPLGNELEDLLQATETAIASPQKLRVDGQFIEVAAYNIKGYNYFRIRDLAIILDFAIIYDDASGEVTLDLENPYDGE